MTKYRALVIGAAVACAVVGAASVHGATRTDFAKKCNSAWSGAKTSAAFRAYQPKCTNAAFRAYQPKCTNAAIAATGAATDAGNPTSPVANRTRAQAACAARFPAPRNTGAKRFAHNACVAAARASQLAFAARPLTASLKGSNEVPPAGGATGSALIRLNEGQRRVCFTITVAGFGAAPATAAHIHEGAAGVSGPAAVAFSDIDSLNHFPYTAKGCVQNVAASTITSIRQRPERFYVNVHNAQYPDGAARGQLGK